jgi:hypothetical protein
MFGRVNVRQAALIDALAKAPHTASAGVARMVLVHLDAASEHEDCLVIVVVGPQRWHPTQRRRFVAELHRIAATVGEKVDVYPIRPSDVASTAAERNSTILRWLRSGVTIGPIR